MNYREQFDFWLADDYFDAKTKEELLAIRNDDKEVEDRFYKVAVNPVVQNNAQNVDDNAEDNAANPADPF